MTDNNKNQDFKNKILKEIENTFSAILDKKFVPLMSGKEVIELAWIKTFCDFAFDEFDEINFLSEYENDSYIQQNKTILIQFLEDVKAKSYDKSVRLHQKCKVVDLDVINAIMEETLHKCKNLK